MAGLAAFVLLFPACRADPLMGQLIQLTERAGDLVDVCLLGWFAASVVG